MLRTSLLAGVVVVTLTAWNAGHATTPAVSASTTDPVPTTTRKPSLGFRKSGADADHPFGWILRDAAGDVLAQGGFDPAKVCRDPSHAGQPPHVVGCEVVPHTAHANVKLPDMGARAATLEFVDRTSVSSPLPLGAIRWSALPLR